MDKFLEDTSAGLNRVWGEAVEIWVSGGWAMIAIAVIAFVMFAVGVHIHLRLRAKARIAVAESRWRRWIDHPRERDGEPGEMLDMVTGGRTLEETAFFFEQLRATETAPFERDLRVMKVCVSAAPLVGLLGTVTGMLTTFGALASGSGGDKTMAMVAKWISEALITTETGLVIALPGLFFQYQLARRYSRYRAFLAHLETVCTQTFHRSEQETRLKAARQAAAQRVRTALRNQLSARAARS